MFLFYVGWWGLVLLVLNDYSLVYQIGLTALAFATSILTKENRRGELVWALTGAVIGYLVDSILGSTGIFIYKGGPSFFAPLWILFLWLLFSCSFSGFEYLKKSSTLLILSGAIGGPLAYWMGEPLGLFRYTDPKWLSIGIHVAIWVVLFPALFKLRDQILARVRT